MPGLIPDDKDSKDRPTLITDVEDKSITNVFCFGAFSGKNTGVMYNDCTRTFPFMSLDGDVCFSVMYHYKINAIFATPIPSLDSKNIIDAYTKNFQYLVSKGYTPKIIIMDNQATKAIKFYLIPQQCCLQLVEPGNHWVNAAECSIQTFKNCFIGALGTTGIDFPIQLWDKLAPQVQDTINLLRRSRINPNISAYEILEGPYNWNHFPLAPLGTKAIIYNDADTWASWAPHGVNAWMLGPSKDHYQCHLYYVPEISGYCVSGSTDLFPQHCIEPMFTPFTHVKELANELKQMLATMRCKKLNLATLKTLKEHADAYIAGNPPPQPLQPLEQRVQQRVIDLATQSLSPILQRVSTPSITALANNPTAPRKLQTTKRTHKRNTQVNTPGSLSCITRVNVIRPTPTVQAPEWSATKRHCITGTREARHNTTASTTTQQHLTRLTMPRLCNTQMISQHTINNLMINELCCYLPHYTPLKLHPATSPPIDLAHHAMPMIHPTTRATISSYCKLMNDPATAEVWMTAFGKDFGRMSQGDNKKGQKGTNAMFVMSPSNIPLIPKDHVITYARVVVNHHLQKRRPQLHQNHSGG
jgi:hypothetical protein